MWKPPSLKLVLKKKKEEEGKTKKGRKQDLKQMPSARFLSCFREEEPCHLPVYQPFLLGSSRFAGNGMSCGTSLALCLRLRAGQDGSCSPEHPGSEPATAGPGASCTGAVCCEGQSPSLSRCLCLEAGLPWHRGWDKPCALLGCAGLSLAWRNHS